MSFLSAPRTPTMPEPPAPPPVVDEGRAAARADAAMTAEMRKRKGRGSTIVAGALSEQKSPTSGTPTLLG